MQSFSVFILVRMLIDEGGVDKSTSVICVTLIKRPKYHRSAPAVKISALMPRMIDYTTVLDQLTREGFKSLYFNSGAFGFPPGVETFSRGWIGEPDRSIRESALALVRQVCEPFVPNLVSLLTQVWQQNLSGTVWVMPKSHWAFELEFGSRDWMPAALQRLGIAWQTLLPLNNAPAIEFEPGENQLIEPFMIELLTRLQQSDFQLVYPGRKTVCAVHAKKQLWWTTADASIRNALDRVLPESAASNFT